MYDNAVRNYTRLLPAVTADGAARSSDWRLLVNSRIEAEAMIPRSYGGDLWRSER